VKRRRRSRLSSSDSTGAFCIENNVRHTIVKERMNNPAYYERMSALLDELIASRKARAIEYEAYLKAIASLVARVEAGRSDDTPKSLNTPGKRAVYDNLRNRAAARVPLGIAEPAVPYSATTDAEALELAIQIDAAVKTSRHDAWRGVQAREQVIKQALYGVLPDVAEVERIFLIVKAQREY